MIYEDVKEMTGIFPLSESSNESCVVNANSLKNISYPNGSSCDIDFKFLDDDNINKNVKINHVSDNTFDKDGITSMIEIVMKNLPYTKSLLNIKVDHNGLNIKVYPMISSA